MQRQLTPHEHNATALNLGLVWDDAKKRAVVIEDKFTFMQVESRLRLIVQEALESVKNRINREADYARTLKQQIDLTRREISEYDLQFSKLNVSVKSFDKFHKDINNLDNYTKVEIEKVTNILDGFENQMVLNDQRFSGVMRQHQAHIQMIDMIKSKFDLTMKQLEDFKNKVSKTVSVELNRAHEISQKL